MEEELNEESIRKIIDHPVRQRIIELLGADGPVSWKGISDQVGISTGALYYHLDRLEGIVSKEEDRKYSLTRAGQRIADYLQTNPSPNPKAVLSVLSSEGRFGIPRRIFTPRQLISKLGSTRPNSIVSSLAISAALVVDLIFVGYVPALFYLARTTNPMIPPIGYAVDFAALLGVVFASSHLLYKSRPSVLLALPGCALSLVPVAVLGTSARFFPVLLKSQLAFTPLLVFSQAWSATLFASAVSVSSGVRIEKAILVSLAVLYATVVLILVANGSL